MSVLNNIFKKIEDKTELASHEVHLATIDNLKKYTNGLPKYMDEGKGLQILGERQKRELSDTIKAVLKWSDLGNSMASDMAGDLVVFERQAKELGIDPNSSKDYNEANKAFKTYREFAKAMQRVSASLLVN